MDDLDGVEVEVGEIPLRRKVKLKKRIYDESMEDDQLIGNFKSDHGLGEKYDE